MTVRTCNGCAGGGANMSKKHMRSDMLAQMAQVLIRPGWAYFPVQARFRVIAVPTETEAIAIGADDRLLRANALRDQRMGGLRDVIFQRDCIAPICDPTAESTLAPAKLPCMHGVSLVAFVADGLCGEP
jgi:hypothetical protein